MNTQATIEVRTTESILSDSVKIRTHRYESYDEALKVFQELQDKYAGADGYKETEPAGSMLGFNFSHGDGFTFVWVTSDYVLNQSASSIIDGITAQVGHDVAPELHDAHVQAFKREHGIMDAHVDAAKAAGAIE